MKLVSSVPVATVLGMSCASAVRAAETAPAAPPAKAKNWTPKTKIQAQALSDEIIAKHPELISVTFHGVPPGLDKVYTMFAGSYAERIGRAASTRTASNSSRARASPMPSPWQLRIWRNTPAV